MGRRPCLRELAQHLGVLSEYVSLEGRQRYTTDEARVTLLAAMGHDASTEAAAAAALTALNRARSGRLLDPVRAVRSGRARPAVLVSLPSGLSGRIDWTVEATDETGSTTRREGRLSIRPRRRVRLPHPGPARPGYYTVFVSVAAGGTHLTDRQLLIVSPATCFPISKRLGRRRAFGLTTNLYTVRGEDDWGVGDLGDLIQLCDWASDDGAHFVGLNPLHALWNRGTDVGPYAPVSRLFRNPLYLDIVHVPELAVCRKAARLLQSDTFRERLDRLRRAPRIDYQGVMRAKQVVLELLHAEFAERHRDRATARGRAYADYVTREGPTLTDFATFMAIDQHLRASRSTAKTEWRTWPRELQHPASRAVQRFRDEHAVAVDFHRYLQFEMDRQLGDTARHAAQAGMRIGLFGDLAIGSAPGGCDPWAFPDLFLDDVELGAPPDAFAPAGQAWGLPAINPTRLRERGYDYWILVARAAMGHTGALRIDHVMGLFRQFWIPKGRPGTEGAYVRVPADELLAVLAVESQRHGTVIVGEDLGTVPKGLPAVLRRWGILSTRVLYFERERSGAFRAASRYSNRALVTANTHDQAPLAGFLEGRDLILRRRAGALASRSAIPGHVEGAQRPENFRHFEGAQRPKNQPPDDLLDAELRKRQLDRRSLMRRLASAGMLAKGETSRLELTRAVYAFLASTPAPLVGVSLDDLAGETEPVNLPGVSQERHPSWTRRLGRTVSELAQDGDVRRILTEVARRRRRLARALPGT